MRAHTLHIAQNVRDAVRRGRSEDSHYIAGGTNQIDLMKEGIRRPSQIVDIANLDMREIADRGSSIGYGSLVSNTAAAEHPLTRQHLPLISMTIVKGATQQIRNMATLGGNVLQGVRCPYFYDHGAACSRREGELVGCEAIGGFDRLNAIFGVSDHCTAANPSDIALSFLAYDATVHVAGPRGNRAIPFSELHRMPGQTPWVETSLRPGELITSFDIPKSPAARNAAYQKIRDRQSYAFATLSVAAALVLDGDRISDAHIAAGGVGTVPWRLREVEARLRGRPATEASFRNAASTVSVDATPGSQNAFKVDLLPVALVRALVDARAGTPSDPTFFS